LEVAVEMWAAALGQRRGFGQPRVRSGGAAAPLVRVAWQMASGLESQVRRNGAFGAQYSVYIPIVDVRCGGASSRMHARGTRPHYVLLTGGDAGA
jgi:hypothetical protein